MQNHKDYYLISDLRTGDLKKESAALNIIYSTCRTSVIEFVKSNSGTREEGEELFQRCVMAVVKNARTKKNLQLTASMKTYINKIAYFLWLNKLRDRKIDLVLTNDLELVLMNKEVNVESYLEVDLYNQEHLLFWEKIDEVGGDCKTLLEQYFTYVPLEEIAKNMGLTYGSLRGKKVRCLTKLKALLGISNESKID